jgi:ABC-type spermidine/putrescine transport system permease subunit I
MRVMRPALGGKFGMRHRVTASAILTGGPMIAWQVVFFLGAAAVLVFMSFWQVKNYQLVVDFSLKNWQSVLGSSLFYSIYLRTVLYALVAALTASLIAFPFSYAIAFKTSPGIQRLSLMLLIVPYFTSYLVRSYSWRFMLEHDGVVNFLLRAIGTDGYEFQGSFISIMIGFYGYFLPLVALIQLLGLLNIDRQFIEAAHNLGSGRLRTVWTVVVPMTRGAVAVGFAFGFMMAMGDYVVPAFVGGDRPTLSVLIVNTIQGQSNFPKAAVISILMLVTLMVVFFAINRFAFRQRRR